MNVAKLGINGHFFNVEVAITPDQRRLGLMHREALANDHGMLLVYANEGDHRIWMKNMLIPLRVYWIDAEFRVVGQRRVLPCEHSPCPVFGISGSSKYILELNDTDHRIEIGDRVSGLSGLR